MGSSSSKSKKLEVSNSSYDLPAGMIRLFIIGLRPSPSNPNQACCKDIHGNLVTIDNGIQIAWIVCDPSITIAALKKTIMLELSLTNSNSTANFLLIHNHLILGESCNAFSFNDYNIENNSCLFLAMNADITSSDVACIEYEPSKFQIEMQKTYPSPTEYQEFRVKTITALDIVMYEENHNCVQMPVCFHGMTIDGLYAYSLVQFNSKEKQITCPHLITAAEAKLDIIDEADTAVDTNVDGATEAVVDNENVNGDTNADAVVAENAANTEPVVVEAQVEAVVVEAEAEVVADVEVQVPVVVEAQAEVVADVAAEVPVVVEAQAEVVADVAAEVPVVVEAQAEVPVVVEAQAEVAEVKVDDEEEHNHNEPTHAVTSLQGERICGQTWHYIFIRKILIFTMMHQKQLTGDNVLSVSSTNDIKTVPSKVPSKVGMHKTESTPITAKKRLSNLIMNVLSSSHSDHNTKTTENTNNSDSSTSNESGGGSSKYKNKEQDLNVVMEILKPQDSSSFASYEGSTENIILKRQSSIVVEKQFTLNDILNLDLVCCRVTASAANYELQQCPSCKSFLFRRKQRKWILSKKNKTESSTATVDDSKNNESEAVADDSKDNENVVEQKVDDEEAEANAAVPEPADDDINLAFLLDLSAEERMAELRVECRVCNNTAFCWYCTKEWENEAPVVNEDGSSGGDGDEVVPRKMCSNGDCASHCFEAQALQILAECDTKKIGSVTDVPSIRSCPKCAQLITHSEACKHIKCTQCQCKFCFVCMSVYDKKWSCGSSSAVCPVGARQSKEIFKKPETVKEEPPKIDEVD